MSDELLEIGRFAATSGLSVTALRHYDEVGILKPQVVDPRTSYRRYRPDQLVDARLVDRGVPVPPPDHSRVVQVMVSTTDYDQSVPTTPGSRAAPSSTTRAATGSSWRRMELDMTAMEGTAPAGCPRPRLQSLDPGCNL